MKNRSFRARLGFAIRGFALAWKSESSLRVQGLFALAAIAALLILMPAPVWWALVALSAALVVGAELINSAIESLCDVVEPEKSEAIRNIKDIAASAVMLVSAAALLVAIALIVNVYA